MHMPSALAAFPMLSLLSPIPHRFASTLFCLEFGCLTIGNGLAKRSLDGRYAWQGESGMQEKNGTDRQVSDSFVFCYYYGLVSGNWIGGFLQEWL